MSNEFIKVFYKREEEDEYKNKYVETYIRKKYIVSFSPCLGTRFDKKKYPVFISYFNGRGIEYFCSDLPFNEFKILMMGQEEKEEEVNRFNLMEM